jgi:hypothetical protein
MSQHPFRWPVAAVLACLLFAGCRDKPEPVKPIVPVPAATAPAA